MRVLTFVIKSSHNPPKILELQNLQATVNQILEGQLENNGRFEKLLITQLFAKEFNPVDWSKKTMLELFSVLKHHKS